MQKLLLLLSTVLIVTLKLFAQDSLPPKGKKLTLKPAGDFDQRFSFLENQPVSIWGYRVGVLVNDKYKTGIGGYFLEQNITGELRLRRNVLYYEQKKKMYFGTVYFEPYLIRKKFAFIK